MSKKFFFFDIDGTLTDRTTGKIVPSAAAAVKKLREAGHFVAINTGRAHYKARKFFDENGFDNMVCNGGKAIVIDGELVENSPLIYEDALRLYMEAIDKGYGVLVSDEDSELVKTRDFSFYEQAGIRKEPTTYVIDEGYSPEKKAIIYKMYISIPEMEEEELLRILPSAATTVSAPMTMIRSPSHGFTMRDTSIAFWKESSFTASAGSVLLTVSSPRAGITSYSLSTICRSSLLLGDCDASIYLSICSILPLPYVQALN